MKYFNKLCKNCVYFEIKKNGRIHCCAYAEGTEEFCEVEDFPFFERKKEKLGNAGFGKDKLE